MGKRRSKLEIIREVIEDQQCVKIKMLIGRKSRTVLLDMQTANRILKVFTSNPLGDVEKINLLSWDRLVGMAWGCN